MLYGGTPTQNLEFLCVKLSTDKAPSTFPSSQSARMTLQKVNLPGEYPILTISTKLPRALSTSFPLHKASITSSYARCSTTIFLSRILSNTSYASLNTHSFILPRLHNPLSNVFIILPSTSCPSSSISLYTDKATRILPHFSNPCNSVLASSSNSAASSDLPTLQNPSITAVKTRVFLCYISRKWMKVAGVLGKGGGGFRKRGK
nr:hypothetical protein Iba_chr05cCG8570 [Ipomoea batatas]